MERDSKRCSLKNQHKNYFKYDASTFGLFFTVWVYFKLPSCVKSKVRI